MNCRQALAHSRKVLEDSGIENSSLEGEILVRFVSGLDRANLFSNLDKELTPAQAERLTNLLERRQWGEPSAYITGHREFYGLDFKVDRRVLIPRPETELLVEKAIAFCREYNFSVIADIGTGSGCIAISLAKSLPDVKIYAVDYSLPALEAAEENITVHGLKNRIELLWGDLLKPLPGPVDMITANLPYVKKTEITSKHEPEMALDGGIDGLDKIKTLITQLPGKLNPKGILLLEIGQGQADEVKINLHNSFPDAVIEVTKDLAGIERVISLTS